MIPLSIPHLNGNEWKYIKDCLDTNWISSVGSYVTAFEEKVAAFVGAKYGVATSNGTAALHISLLLAGVENDDYVIAPNITFIASINSIKYCNADPILIDVDASTWQMDLDVLEDFLANQTILKKDGLYLKSDNRRIKAIMPVHVLGNMVDMKRFMDIVQTYHLEVVEDATEALGSYYDGQHAGTFGKFGCFSFNGNKIITTGGGGVIVTNDEVLAKKAKHLTTQAKADRMEYIHDEIGYNYRLVNVLAAMGVAQMEQLSDILKRKQEIADFYYQHLKNDHIDFQEITSNVDTNQWLFTIKTMQQKVLLKSLNENAIQARPFWKPMNQLRMFKNDLYIQQKDISNEVYQNCLSIPCSAGITTEELSTVVRVIKSSLINPT